MEKTTEQKEKKTVARVTELSFKAKAELNELDSGKDYIAVLMRNPFAGTDFDEEVTLSFTKPDNRDKFGNPVQDFKGERNKGLFEYKAKPMLKHSDQCMELSGKITYRKYKKFDYVCIELDNPFEKESIRMHIKKPAIQSVFEMLAKERLELTA